MAFGPAKALAILISLLLLSECCQPLLAALLPAASKASAAASAQQAPQPTPAAAAAAAAAAAQAPASTPASAAAGVRAAIAALTARGGEAAPAAAAASAAAAAATLTQPAARLTPAGLAAAPEAAPRPAPPPACTLLPRKAGGLLQHNGQNIFLTGVNLGNVQFLPFEGNPYNMTAAQLRNMLERALAEIAATGANSVRFWLHIDGSRSPSWGTDQVTGQPMVLGLPPGFVQDLQWLLSTAYQQHGLLLSISLWSHDVLAVRLSNPEANRARAILMMSDDRATDAYLSNALVPMLRTLNQPMALGGPRFLDAVLAIEVLNEPEGMSSYWRLYKNYQYNMSRGNYTWGSKSYPCLSHPSRSRNASLYIDSSGGLTAKYNGWYFTLDDGEFNSFMYHDVIDNYPSEWDFLKRHIVNLKTLTKQEVLHTKLLRFVNRVAGAIKRAAPGTKVTVGAHSMPYNSDVPIPNLKLGRSDYPTAPFNYWKDSVLVAAGGDPQGVLDFYSVHGYPIWGEPRRDIDISMFSNPKSRWCLDKPVVVGEHWSEVLSMKEIVTPANYVHLLQTGYAGAWGWAWFNVTEAFNSVSGVGVRGVAPHSNQEVLRRLLMSLPAGLRYPVHASNNTAGSGNSSGRLAPADGSKNGALPAAAVAGTAVEQAFLVSSG